MLACFPSFSSFTYQQQSKKRYKKRSYKASSAITLILQQKKEEKKEMKMKQTLKFITSVFVWALIMNQSNARYRTGFIKTRGCHFVVNGSPFLANGFNAYWLMLLASNPSERSKVSNAFKEASSHGLTVVRTWAFSDGGPVPLQVYPGSYNQQMFQGLDFVISEARRYRMRVILSLANNYDSFGGKKQYVEWARNEGQNIGSDDDFFTNYVAKQYYKNHVKAVLTRYNTITKVMYKDDPTIFAWELMNEPRCTSDLSGNTIQAWITEMAAHVKSIDSNHLLEAGLEGFYSGYDQGRNKANPAGFQVGTDFISNNKVAGIDFATLHSYPDQWLSNTNDEAQLQFLNTWLDTHIEDSENVLKKPLLLTEFGKSWKDPGFSNSQRDVLFNAVYSKIYMSARRGGAAAGGMFWQLLIGGMDNYRDGYEIVLTDNSSTNTVITVQSKRLHYLGKLYSQKYKNAVAQVRKRLSKGVSKERKDIGN